MNLVQCLDAISLHWPTENAKIVKMSKKSKIVKMSKNYKIGKLSKIVKIVKIIKNCQNCENHQKLRKSSKIVKIVKIRTELPLEASACSSYQPDLLLMTDETANQVVWLQNFNIVPNKSIKASWPYWTAMITIGKTAKQIVWLVNYFQIEVFHLDRIQPPW